MARPARRWSAVVAGCLLPLLALSLAGCRKAERRAGDLSVVGFSPMGRDNPSRLAQTQSLREEAAKRGSERGAADAQDQTATQVAPAADLIARRVDVILLAPREFEGLAPALQAAR